MIGATATNESTVYKMQPCAAGTCPHEMKRPCQTSISMSVLANLETWLCQWVRSHQRLHPPNLPAAAVQSNVVYERQSVAERTLQHIQRRCSRPDHQCVSLPSDWCFMNILSSKISKLTGAKVLTRDLIPSSTQATTVPDPFHGARKVLVCGSLRKSSTGSMATIVVQFAGFLVPLAMASPLSRRRLLK